jgi:hypothetical protein
MPKNEQTSHESDHTIKTFLISQKSTRPKDFYPLIQNGMTIVPFSSTRGHPMKISIFCGILVGQIAKIHGSSSMHVQYTGRHTQLFYTTE